MFSRRPPASDSRVTPDSQIGAVTDATFEAFTTTGHSSSVIDFYADWCGPCHQLEPAFRQAAARYPELIFGRLDVDHNPRTASQLNVLSIPTVVVFDPAGMEIDRFVGAAGFRQLDTFVSRAISPSA